MRITGPASLSRRRFLQIAGALSISPSLLKSSAKADMWSQLFNSPKRAISPITPNEEFLHHILPHPTLCPGRTVDPIHSRNGQVSVRRHGHCHSGMRRQQCSGRCHRHGGMAGSPAQIPSGEGRGDISNQRWGSLMPPMDTLTASP